MWTQARTRCLVCRVLALWIAGVVAFMLGVTVLILMLAPKARAMDSGQYGSSAPHIRQWFKAQRAPGSLVPCCDEADGHEVQFRGDETIGFEAFVEGAWRKVPPEKVIKDSRNPLLGAIAWYSVTRYTNSDGSAGPVTVHFRCFVPGGGV